MSVIVRVMFVRVIFVRVSASIFTT